DVEPFTFARPLAQLKGFRRKLRGEIVLKAVEVHKPQLGVGQSEIRIKLHGMLEKRSGFRNLSRQVHLVARGKSLQSIQRRRGGLFNGSIELLNRAKRLA